MSDGVVVKRLLIDYIFNPNRTLFCDRMQLHAFAAKTKIKTKKKIKTMTKKKTTPPIIVGFGLDRTVVENYWSVYNLRYGQDRTLQLHLVSCQGNHLGYARNDINK